MGCDSHHPAATDLVLPGLVVFLGGTVRNRVVLQQEEEVTPMAVAGICVLFLAIALVIGIPMAALAMSDGKKANPYD